MKKIQAIVRTDKLEDLKKKIGETGIANGMTVSQVLGFGHQKGFDEYIRGQKIVTTLLAKVQIEVVVPEEKVDALVDLILENAQTGEVGDGKIFIIPVDDVIRIRTGERGREAL